MSYCSECGQQLVTPTAKFCSACGTAVPSAPASASTTSAVAASDGPHPLPPVSPRVQPRDPSPAPVAPAPPATHRHRGRNALLGLLMVIAVIAAYLLGARSTADDAGAMTPPPGESAVAEPGAPSTSGTGDGMAPSVAASPSSASSGPAEAGTPVMPSVVGMVLQDAQDLLQSQGSYLMDQQDATGDGRFQFFDSNWKVCSQDPPAGVPLSAVDVVTLKTVKLDESCP